MGTTLAAAICETLMVKIRDYTTEVALSRDEYCSPVLGANHWELKWLALESGLQ